MKNKGFTLIELLAVIVILAIIALIATPIIINIIGDTQEESNERSVEQYASAVKNAVARHYLNSNDSAVGDYTQSEEGKTLTGPVTLKVDYDGKVECRTIKIDEDGKVSLAGCTVNGSTKEYTYGTKEDVEVAVTPICTAVTEANATKMQAEPIFDGEGNESFSYTMNIPTGQYNIGDEYVCEVAPNTKYHFYILSENEDDTLNLIMEANVSEQVAYLSQSDYTTAGGTLKCEDLHDCVTVEKGPITAYRVLKEATDGWSNVPDLTKTYTSSDGQYSFTMSGKARMPEESEYVYDTWWQDIRTEMAMNYFMIDVANDSFNSDAHTGSNYWLLEDLDPTLTGASFTGGGMAAESLYGVRPVITVQKGHLQ